MVVIYFYVVPLEETSWPRVSNNQTFKICFVQPLRKIFKCIPPLIIPEHRSSVCISEYHRPAALGQWSISRLRIWYLQPFQEFSKLWLTLALPYGLNACLQLDYVRLCWTMCTSRMLLQICVTLKNCRSCILRLFSSTQTHTQEATGRFASKDHSRSESETHPDILTAFLAVEGHVLS